MKVPALIEGHRIQWLTPLQIKFPIQVILEIPDDAVIIPVEPKMQLQLPPNPFLTKMDALLGTIPVADSDHLMQERYFKDRLKDELSL